VLGLWLARFASCLSDSIPLSTAYKDYGKFYSSSIIHGIAYGAGKKDVFAQLCVSV
jgi:hypothetical protein